jgi:hypothetical protein
LKHLGGSTDFARGIEKKTKITIKFLALELVKKGTFSDQPYIQIFEFYPYERFSDIFQIQIKIH